jgi:hypothetical protein
VNLKLRSHENSTISVCVIDQSVELLKKPNELTNDLIESFIDTFKLSQYYPTPGIAPKPFFRRVVADMMSLPFSGGYWERPPELIELNVKIE